MSLRALLEKAAADLEQIDVGQASDGTMTWARAGNPFAVLNADGAAVEFALDLAVATAAARTPDVAPSPRGGGWVRFRPTALDEHAADRATAWFVSAHRRLARG